MKILETSVFVIYFSVIVLIAFFSYRKQKSDVTFVLGNRSLNFWLTALSAHASDMSSWLFMGYPMIIFAAGIFNVWAAIGLVFFMYLNWQFIAPKIRNATEKMNNLTMYAYFESRYQDKTRSIRILSAIISFVFYLFYISSGLVGLGLLVDSLFGFSYTTGITLGLLIVVFYVYLGGYVTVAWIDLFQGFFLLAVILTIPVILISKIGGFSPIIDSMRLQNLTTSLFPSFSLKTFLEIIFIGAGWGLGYFGQPHIITKFMGIKNVNEIPKAKFVGISWQALALGGATLFGLLGIYFFNNQTTNGQLIVLDIVKKTLDPFFAALILCAILAATTNVMAAQILVVASSISEDFYKGIFNKQATHLQTLKASRISVIAIAVIAYIISYFKISTIYQLVLYSWSGLGSAFGPLLLVSLYYKKANKTGAFIGILTGGLIAGIWPLVNNKFNIDVPPMIPGFCISLIAIYLCSLIKEKKAVI
ncbi:MAG: sodium/proline symporter [Parachlamydiales bacterium]|jgi:sodium/proline symporter